MTDTEGTEARRSDGEETQFIQPIRDYGRAETKPLDLPRATIGGYRADAVERRVAELERRRTLDQAEIIRLKRENHARQTENGELNQRLTMLREQNKKLEYQASNPYEHIGVDMQNMVNGAKAERKAILDKAETEARTILGKAHAKAEAMTGEAKKKSGRAGRTGHAAQTGDRPGGRQENRRKPRTGAETPVRRQHRSRPDPQNSRGEGRGNRRGGQGKDRGRRPTRTRGRPHRGPGPPAARRRGRQTRPPHAGTPGHEPPRIEPAGARVRDRPHSRSHPAPPHARHRRRSGPRERSTSCPTARCTGPDAAP